MVYYNYYFPMHVYEDRLQSWQRLQMLSIFHFREMFINWNVSELETFCSMILYESLVSIERVLFFVYSDLP